MPSLRSATISNQRLTSFGGVFQAWESYQFRDWRGRQEVVVVAWKALHRAGGCEQIHYRPIYEAPGHAPRGRASNVEHVEPPVEARATGPKPACATWSGATLHLGRP